MPHRFKIVTASWISKDLVCIFLSHDWPKDDSPPSLYFNSELTPITGLQPAPLSLFGKSTGYFREGKDVTFLCPTENLENTKVYVAGSFNNWEAAIGEERWQLQIKEVDGKQMLSLTLPWSECHLSDKQTLFKFVTDDKVWLQVPVDAPNFSLDSNNNSNYQIDSDCTGHNVFVFLPPDAYDPSKFDYILWSDEDGDYSHIIDDSKIFLTLGSIQPLGAIIEGNTTVFRLFAPRAKHVEVTFYDNLDNKISFRLKRNKDYTWELNHPMNLAGKYYYYSVFNIYQGFGNNSNPDFEILDPYAIATVSPSGPGIIIDHKSVPHMAKGFNVPEWTDLVILEAHLRDLVSNTLFGSDFQVPVGFRNLAAWLDNKRNYLKELGIDAIELLPIQEYESQSSFEYHWGYMPTNYFCPSSSYISDKNGISQITEFQDLVYAFHKAGIAVILDVVYNHSGSPNHLLHIDREYYFELTKEGTLTNWCGCGNDFRAKTPMGKRLIIDSLTYLINTYDIDGFRFDLAELIGLEVLKEIELSLKALKPSIILIAEPWSFRGHIAHALKSTGFASWNDGYREFIADFVLDRSNLDAFQYFITGSTSYLARFTTQSLNYASSHDDYCWLDRITENPNHDGSQPTVHDIERTHLMIAILMMSIGIPMLAEGQDILLSKHGHYNTYKRGDLNALNYTNAVKYSNTHDYFSKWIQFRLSEKGRAIRIGKIPSSRYFKFYKNEPESVVAILYNADHSLNNIPQLFFALNQHLTTVTLDVPDLDLSKFIQIADHNRFDAEGLKSSLIEWETHLILPPLSCGLWIEKRGELKY